MLHKKEHFPPNYLTTYNEAVTANAGHTTNTGALLDDTQH